MNKEVFTKNIEVCEIGYYSKESGLKTGSIPQYVVVYFDGINYYNFFNEDEMFPIVERVKIVGNGRKNRGIVSLSYLSDDSKCFIRLNDGSFTNIYNKKYVTKRQICDFVLYDKRYFPDRLNIALDDLFIERNVVGMNKIINDDLRIKSIIDNDDLSIRKMK